ncbi:hypothetical protein MPR_1533 [Myroides profundi]|nr:hypothetical protein MPR_1533 [Myroides profundi]
MSELKIFNSLQTQFYTNGVVIGAKINYNSVGYYRAVRIVI